VVVVLMVVDAVAVDVVTVLTLALIDAVDVVVAPGTNEGDTDGVTE
jgi:hypothetical protein